MLRRAIYTALFQRIRPSTLPPIATQNFTGIIKALIIALPALWNVGSILLLLFFTFGYVAVQLFGSLARGAVINEHANFETLPNALLVLVRVATSDEWRPVMEAC